jgi:hypothetical protein
VRPARAELALSRLVRAATACPANAGSPARRSAQAQPDQAGVRADPA